MTIELTYSSGRKWGWHAKTKYYPDMVNWDGMMYANGPTAGTTLRKLAKKIDEAMKRQGSQKE